MFEQTSQVWSTDTVPVRCKFVSRYNSCTDNLYTDFIMLSRDGKFDATLYLRFQCFSSILSSIEIISPFGPRCPPQFSPAMLYYLTVTATESEMEPPSSLETCNYPEAYCTRNRPRKPVKIRRRARQSSAKFLCRTLDFSKKPLASFGPASASVSSSSGSGQDEWQR